MAPPIPELLQEQWLVTHQEERHSREVRMVIERLSRLLRDHGALFRGEQKLP